MLSDPLRCNTQKSTLLLAHQIPVQEEISNFVMQNAPSMRERDRREASALRT